MKKLHHATPRWLTNIELEHAPLIAQAAKETGFAVYAEGPGVDPVTLQPAFSFLVAVWTKEPLHDADPFWAAYHRLKEAAKETT